MDAWRPYTNSRNCDLWTFPNIFLWKPFFFLMETAKFKATRSWQTAPLRHCLTNLLRLTEKETKNWQMSTLDKNKLTWHDHNDWLEPITNLGLFKIGNFGQVLHLWRKITMTKDRRTKYFSVKAKLLYVR